MTDIATSNTFDSRDPLSIYEYSGKLVGHSLRALLGDEAVNRKRKGKGGLGQMVEELFFQYQLNSSQEADFKDAKLELKCTPIKATKQQGQYTIKERLVCTMIDYFEIINTDFENSHLLAKCRLMLLLFYLYTKGRDIYDYEFIFRILWELPEKDLLLIKNDYETIAAKVRNGKAHLLSEGDTLYLGACRKGQKGDAPQRQPCSTEKAMKRAFSLKPAYMRYVLGHVIDSNTNAYTNYRSKKQPTLELVTAHDLRKATFEDIIIRRFKPYYGLNYLQICARLDIVPYQSKSKYADVANLIASNGQSKRISTSDEFQKSGIILKTVRLRKNGMPKESMAFKNINYVEVYENDNWPDSEIYEIFTSRFMFVIFKPTGNTISFIDKSGNTITEDEYILHKVFFWTMPAEDLKNAQAYWGHIRKAVLENHISLQSFWSIRDHRNFHVRPKAKDKASSIAINPNGGSCEKYCYWFNAEYVKRIIDEQN